MGHMCPLKSALSSSLWSSLATLNRLSTFGLHFNQFSHGSSVGYSGSSQRKWLMLFLAIMPFQERKQQILSLKMWFNDTGFYKTSSWIKFPFSLCWMCFWKFLFKLLKTSWHSKTTGPTQAPTNKHEQLEATPHPTTHPTQAERTQGYATRENIHWPTCHGHHIGHDFSQLQLTT